MSTLAAALNAGLEEVWQYPERIDDVVRRYTPKNGRGRRVVKALLQIAATEPTVQLAKVAAINAGARSSCRAVRAADSPPLPHRSVRPVIDVADYPEYRRLMALAPSEAQERRHREFHEAAEARRRERERDSRDADANRSLRYGHAYFADVPIQVGDRLRWLRTEGLHLARRDLERLGAGLCLRDGCPVRVDRRRLWCSPHEPDVLPEAERRKVQNRMRALLDAAADALGV